MNKKYNDEWFSAQIAELRGLTSGRKAKYLRNYRRYNNTPRIGLENIKDPSIVGYYQLDASPEDDTTPTPSINVIKSAIDTLVSKMAQSKVRPFFNCINGSFEDIQICKQSQQFFDQYFDFEDVNKKVSEAFRDGAVFDTGWIYIDEESKRISRALPWQVYFRPSEMTYGSITRIAYERPDYPVTLLPQEIADMLDSNIQYVKYGIYYDTVNHVKCQYCDQSDKTLKSDYEPDRIPFVFMHYASPIFGNTSCSVVDMLNSIQLEIDTLMAKIKDASQLNPANTYFIPEESNIKVTQLNNRVGNVVKYKSTPNMTGSPVTTSTPAFIDAEYIELVDNLVQKAYEMVGISALSAQSKKPSGLDSGVALSTMEDVESDRFETQLNQVIRCYVDIAKTCIAVFDSKDNILPENVARVSIKWGDIVKETKKMTIQFSGADSLSKDPSEKLKQLQTLSQAGIIPASRIASFMEIPDINSGYSLSNNAINAVFSVIDDCLRNDNYDIPVYIPYDMLEEEIINTQLSLRAANYSKNKESIDKLTKLYDIAEDNSKQWQMTQQAQAAAQAEQAQQAKSGGLTAGQNVLEREAGMEKSPDLSMETDDTRSAGWNRGTNYSQNPQDDAMTAQDNQNV